MCHFVIQLLENYRSVPSVNSFFLLTLSLPPLSSSLIFRRASTVLFKSLCRRRPKSLNMVEPPDRTTFCGRKRTPLLQSYEKSHKRLTPVTCSSLYDSHKLNNKCIKTQQMITSHDFCFNKSSNKKNNNKKQNKKHFKTCGSYFFTPVSVKLNKHSHETLQKRHVSNTGFLREIPVLMPTLIFKD